MSNKKRKISPDNFDKRKKETEDSTHVTDVNNLTQPLAYMSQKFRLFRLSHSPFPNVVLVAHVNGIDDRVVFREGEEGGGRA